MGVVRRSSKKMKSASGDSSSTSPERNRRDDIAIDIELERGGSGAGLSCGSTGGLGGLDGYQDGGTNQQAASTISNIHQISVSQRMDRHQTSQDQWHHKSYSPASTTHASVIGGGGTTQVVARGYSGGLFFLALDSKFFCVSFNLYRPPPENPLVTTCVVPPPPITEA